MYLRFGAAITGKIFDGDTKIMNKEAAKLPYDASQVDRERETNANAFFPADTGNTLLHLLNEYRNSDGQPIEVSFRQLVPWVYGGSRASHYLHSYPAKLLPQIAHFFLANQQLCPKDGVVLDPFSGSGTVALEAVLSGRDAYFGDVNPFARLLTKVKTTCLLKADIDLAMNATLRTFDTAEAVDPPDVVNLNYWYNDLTADYLARLNFAISKVENEDVKHLLMICFSSVAKKLSRANPRFSVPVRLKVDGEPIDIVADKDEVWLCFETSVSRATKQVAGLADASSLGNTFQVSDSILQLGDDWPSLRKDYGDIDLVITSPPYAGAQKYVRATSLSLGWLEQVKSKELKDIENLTLGREHLPKTEVQQLKTTSISAADTLIDAIAKDNATRAAIASVFLREMKLAAERTMSSLKCGGYAVVVMADNTVCGRRFPTTNFTTELFEQAGGVKVLELKDKIVSRSLQTKRASTSSSISHETITVFKKDK